MESGSSKSIWFIKAFSFYENNLIKNFPLSDPMFDYTRISPFHLIVNRSKL